eukprot:403339807
MKTFINIVVILLLGVTTLVNGLNFNKHPVRQEVIDRIKNSNVSWTPFEIEENPFKNKSLQSMRNMGGNLGYIKEESGIQGNIKHLKSKFFQELKKMGHKLKGEHIHVQDEGLNPKLGASLPTAYNTKTAFPSCPHTILDQANCGSCWAHAAVTMLQNRFCIKSGGSINMQFSRQDMVSCDLGNAACNGGYLSSSVQYLQTEGVVSEQCLAYASADGNSVPRCNYRCDDKSLEYKKYGCKYNSMKILTTYEDIKEEIYTNGPVMVGFVVYDDFSSYSTGIYEVTPDSVEEGGHAVTLNGWGYDNGRLYWIGQNQWQNTWGESGFFRIYAGEAGIDLMAFSCEPDLS